MSRALELCSGEEIQVPFCGVAQFLDTKPVGRALASRPPVVVAGIGETALDASVADDKRQARGLEVEWDALCFQGTAVNEQGRTGLAEQRGILIHYAAAHPYVVVLGSLADEESPEPSGTFPAKAALNSPISCPASPIAHTTPRG